MENSSIHKKIFIALCAIILFSSYLKAQPAKTPVQINEIMLNSFVSGNSFGLQRNPSVGVLIGKRFLLSAGPVFNRRFQKNTGGLVSARYFLVRDNESYNGHFRLSSVFSLQRMHNQSLSKTAIEQEQMMAFNMKNDESAGFCELRYKGWEAAAGFAGSYRFGFGMILRAEVTLCYFTTQQQTCPEINTFHDEKGTSLRLGFGIGWVLNKKTTQPASSNAPHVRAQIGE